MAYNTEKKIFFSENSVSSAVDFLYNDMITRNKLKNI